MSDRSSKIAVAGLFGIVGILTGHFDAMFLTAVTFRIEGFFDNDNLLAIPLLVFMGMVLERTGIAEDMLLALNGLFGRVPGGLAYTVVIVGAVMSAITGFVSASVMALGLISLPPMLRLGYDHRFAAGTIMGPANMAPVGPFFDEKKLATWLHELAVRGIRRFTSSAMASS